MNMEEMIKSLLEGQQSLIERTTRVEEKLDRIAAVERHMENIEGRVQTLERAPGGRWMTITQSILSSIGTAIGAALIAAFVYFTNKK